MVTAIINGKVGPAKGTAIAENSISKLGFFEGAVKGAPKTDPSLAGNAISKLGFMGGVFKGGGAKTDPSVENSKILKQVGLDLDTILTPRGKRKKRTGLQGGDLGELEANLGA